MKHKELYFLSTNRFKIDEMVDLFKQHDLSLMHYKYKIDELQTKDTDLLLKDKAIKAFKFLKRPVFVEHTGLYLKELNDFPGGLTQVFWDSLKEDKFSRLFASNENNVVAKTMIGLVDGKNYKSFKGEVSGRISEEPKGAKGFQWDCVFIQEGHHETYAELGTDRKNNISMRKSAFDSFMEYLKEH